jgi:hypothetical protein
MEANLPILWNHDHTRKPIGMVEVSSGLVSFRFDDSVRISHENMFEIFGGAGIKVTEMERLEDGTVLIKAGSIMEFSLQHPAI